MKEWFKKFFKKACDHEWIMTAKPICYHGYRISIYECTKCGKVVAKIEKI